MLAGVGQNLKVERRAAAAMPLVAGAQEPVAFYGPGFGSALLKYHPYAELLTVSGAAPLLALPVERRRGHDRALQTIVTPSSLPQVARAQADEAVLAFLNGLQRPLRFTSLPEDSLFFSELKAHAAQLKYVARWERAALRVNGTYEDWFEASFEQKRRREWKRQYKRLSEQGRLELSREVDAEGYLALEARGWKGRAGTALQSQADTATQFKEICAKLAASGALRFWTLKLDDRAVASLVGIVEGEQAWILKIAYDEDYAKFSPGVLLVLDATRDFFADGKIRLADSCAIPDHPMINRVWRDRIAFADVLVAPQSVSAVRFAMTHGTLVAMRQARQALKPLYLKLKGRKLS